MQIKRVLGPRRLDGRFRLVRVEFSTERTEAFVSLSVLPRFVGLWRSYREFRATLAGVQVHYRETAWS